MSALVLNPWTTRVTFVAVSFLAAIACSSATNAEHERLLRIETSQNDYAPGDSVSVSITNVGSRGIAFFACPVFVDRSIGSGWIDYAILPGFGDDDCDLMTMPLATGNSTELRAQLAAFPPGVYRLRLDGLREQGVKLPIEDRVSNSFNIQ